jgi:signal transduction histidine kinase
MSSAAWRRVRTAELQERNEELETFAYSISHDLRSPLRAMEGFSQALLEDYADRLDQTGRQHAERVVNAARTMDRLIDDLLAYSRLTRSDLHLRPLDLHQSVRTALEQLEAEVKSRQARIEIEEPLPAVVGHAPTLAQVLANLLANGIKFVPPGRTPEVRVRAEARDGRVRLWIEDNGIGVAPEHHERIFRVFERLHRTTEYPGTGIGLAIVRKAMERMGGSSGLESEPGRGSRFWIELPRAAVIPAAQNGG